MKTKFYWQGLLTALGLASLVVPAYPSTAEIISPVRSQSQLLSLEFPPSPNRQSPKASAGGGRRGGTCDYNNSALPADRLLVALMPDRVRNSGDFKTKYSSSAKTVASNPDFWFYIPENKAEYANFSLKDPQGNTIASLERIALPSMPGIIKLQLPDTLALEVDGQYEWSFSLVCSPKSETMIGGVIERVKLDANVQAKLEQTEDLLAKAQLYAQNYIWSETLSILAGLKESNSAEWKQLLESAGLGEYTEQKLLDFPQQSLHSQGESQL